MPLPRFLQPASSIAFAVADDEPLGGSGVNPNKVNLSVQPQEEDNWCWAAVGVSIAAFYDSSHEQMQCELACLALGRDDCCGGGRSDKAKCDKPWRLAQTLGLNGNFNRMRAEAIALNDIQSEIESGSPIACRVEWSGGAGHFLVITGWLVGVSGKEYVDVSDPIYGDQPLVEMNEFTTNYQGGSWSHTYFTMASDAGGSAAAPDEAEDALGS